MNGIINLYKPKGISSAAAVSAVRRVLGIKKVGHMGTLDPMAEGVLLIGVGKATRLFDYFLKKDKEYEAEFTFGFATDTLDAEGKVTATTGKLPSFEELKRACDALTGTIEQLPPDFCAKSVNGVRAYKAARKGTPLQLKPSVIQVYSFVPLSFSGGACRVKIHCGAGTYIRSLCRDLAETVGSLATMTALKRTRCGEYRISDALNIEELKGQGETALIPIAQSLSGIPRFDLDEKFLFALSNGLPVIQPDAPCGSFALFCGGELFGLALKGADDRIKISTYLKE